MDHVIALVPDRADRELHDDEREEHAQDERDIRLQATEKRGRLRQNVAREIRRQRDRVGGSLRKHERWHEDRSNKRKDI